MNLSKLFEMQAKMEAHIEREHPRKENEDRLAKKILALQVELGELAQNWRGFKFWSHDQKPRRAVYEFCEYCEGRGELGFQREACWYCCGEGQQIIKRPLLKEYVDCLHFILSIGLERKLDYITFESVEDQENNITNQFNMLFSKIGDFMRYKTIGNYQAIGNLFLGLGEMLGFSWKEVERAYIEKNKVNHE